MNSDMKLHNGDESDGFRILVFKGDPHAVNGQGVLIILVSVVMSGNMSLHCGNICYILHTKKEQGKKKSFCAGKHAVNSPRHQWEAKYL